MKKSIHVLLFLVISISANDVTDMPDICQDFLDPQKKKQMLVPGQEERKGIHVDINNDGTEEKVLLEVIAQPVSTLLLSIYDKNDKRIRIKEYENSRLNQSMQILSYREHNYIIHYADIFQRFPTYITSTNSQNIEKPICKYKNEKTLKLVAHDDTHNPSKCNALLNRFKEGKTVPFTIPSKLPKKDLCTKYIFRHCGDNRIRGIGYFDYDNDGKKEYVQQLEYIYDERDRQYAVIDDHKTLRYDTLIMHIESWVEENNKTYYIDGYLQDISNPPSIMLHYEHKSVKICEYQYEPITTLDINLTKENN